MSSSKKILITLTQEEADLFKAMACVLSSGNTSQLVRSCVNYRQSRLTKDQNDMLQKYLDSRNEGRSN